MGRLWGARIDNPAAPVTVTGVAGKQRRSSAKPHAVRVSAVMIAKDEAQHIGATVEAIRRFVDDVVVADTGSTDGTPAIAEQAGARVVHVTWPGSFAQARNDAATFAAHDCILSVDADEVATGSPSAFRKTLGAQSGVGSIWIRNTALTPENVTEFPAARLYDRTRVRYAGRVHETLVAPDGSVCSATFSVPMQHLTLLHSGYADPVLLQRKGERNLALAQRELDDPDVSASRRSRLLVEVTRSAFAAGNVDACVTAARSALACARDGERDTAAATAARALLSAGRAADAVEFVSALEQSGRYPALTAWLAGSVMLQFGQPSDAVALFSFAAAQPLVFPGGTRQSPLAALYGLRHAQDMLGDHTASAATTRRIVAAGGS